MSTTSVADPLLSRAIIIRSTRRDQRSFPSIHGITLRGTRSLELSEALELSGEQREAMGSLRTWHDRRMGEINRRLEQKLESEALETLKGPRIMDAVLSDMSNREAIRELMDDREGVSEEMLARLEKILRGEQFERIRARPNAPG